MFLENQPADALIHALSVRLARECRSIVQVCLREEEWADADREFYRITRAGLEELTSSGEEGRGPHAATRRD